MIFSIAAREFKTLFLSPLAWSMLAIIQFVLAYLFLSQIEAFKTLQPRLIAMSEPPGIAEIIIAPLFGNTAVILMLAAPLLTMRLISEERRNKTLALLLSAPVNSSQIVLGKFLAVFGLLSITVFLTGLMPFSLMLGANLDLGKFFANLLALLLLTAAFTSVGLFWSCIAHQPAVAAIGTLGISLLLWILDWSSGFNDHPNGIIEYLSIMRHFQNLQTGLLGSVDIGYFLLFCGLFLILSILRLDNERLQKMSPSSSRALKVK